MAGSKMVAFGFLVALQLAAAADPCTTAGPPPPTCATFVCPASYSPKSGNILCGGAHTPACDTSTCCDIITTVTTTPAPTEESPCTTVVTTPGPTQTTTPEVTVTTTPEVTVTTTPGPTEQSPCTTVVTTPGPTQTTTPEVTVTTTPEVTVTTTPAPTQESPCTTVVTTPGPTQTTTPEVTVTTTPAPTKPPPVDPCAPTNPAAQRLLAGCSPLPRKYDAKESKVFLQKTTAKKEANMMPAWALPFMGVLAMFSFFALVGSRAHRAARRSTRRVQLVEPVLQSDRSDSESLLTDDDTVLE